MLVVGRSDEVRDLIVEILASLGYRVDVAEDAQEALTAMRQRPDVVLIDSLDAAEARGLLARRREDAALARLPVGLLAQAGPRRPWYDLGVGAVVRKPFRTMELVRTVRELAGANGSRREV